jgi:hypothetical protein
MPQPPSPTPVTTDALMDEAASRLRDADHLFAEVARRSTETDLTTLRDEYVGAEQYLLAFIADCGLRALADAADFHDDTEDAEDAEDEEDEDDEDPAMELMHCDDCGEPLEAGQIGTCDAHTDPEEADD